MFRLISKIYNGSTLVKYEVLDLNNNTKKIMSVDMLHGLAMAGSIENASYNERTCTLSGDNGTDLRRLPRRQDTINKTSTDLSILVGKNLYNFVCNSTADFINERYLIKDVQRFLDTPCKGKVCALYGLRRTGKTILMHHAIKSLFNNNKKNVAYISLTENIALSDVYKSIDKLVNKNIEYIFIDEVTAVNGFLQSSALLADRWAKSGVHIVVAGTDSYILSLASKNNLYDRVVMLNTTYIGYKEYAYLNPGTSILEYIRVGGVLPANIFYDKNQTEDYINTAISDNIFNSLVRANNKKEHKHLLELIDRGLFKKAIEQAIEDANTELTTSIITREYINSTLGSAKQLLESLFDIDSTLDIDEVTERVRYKLSIVRKTTDKFNTEYIDELKNFLIEIGAIQMYERYVCNNRRIKKIEVPLFVQPGLRYRQTVALINSLCETPSFMELPKNIREKLKTKIIEDTEGNLIEHEIIMSELHRNAGKNIEVTQLTYESKEIDMIVNDNNTVSLFEIKRNNNAVDEQAKWLINDDINKFIEKMFSANIKDRTVLYLGVTTSKKLNNKEVKYANIEDYLFSM